MSTKLYLSAAIALIGLTVLPTATFAAPTSSVRLVRLECHNTEDSTGADEAYLNYNGNRVFGIKKINDGQSRNIGVVKSLSGTATVSLYDEDWPDGDDFLGSIIIRADERGTGLRSQNFTRDGAFYTLFYRVD